MASFYETSSETTGAEFLAAGVDADIVRIQHGEDLRRSRGLLRASRRDPVKRDLIVALANSGYYLYSITDDFSGLIHHSSIRKRPRLTDDGRLKIDKNGILYSLEPARNLTGDVNLLVIFSTVHESTSFLSRHFFQNFKTIAKFIPDNTAILRIADVGSVKGAFYLNTNYLTQNEANIRNLIGATADRLKARNTVLYGTSKGGTAALFHGITGGWRAVSVDPILSDHYYTHVERYDPHYTIGTFPMNKEVKFAELFAAHSGRTYPDISLICSSRSPQFTYIESLLGKPYPTMVSMFDSRNSNINSHPDVAPNTLPMAVSLISMALYGLPTPNGRFVIS